jgi:hypothetical protein
MAVFRHALNVHRPTRNAMLERLPLEKLHDNKTLAIVLVDVIDGADVRVIQGRGRSRFALKSLNGWMILGKLLGKKFQAHVAAETDVLGFVHDPHSAAAQLFQNAVVGDGTPDHEKETAIRGSS